jgi:nucleotide-binding universal stress UspA family protein
MPQMIIHPHRNEFDHVLAEIDLNPRVRISKILVTTDFSEVSEHALNYAVALARRYDGCVYLAHVISPDPFQFAEPQLAQASYEKVRAAAELGITDILLSGKLHGIPHEVLVEEGNVWPVLEKMIRQNAIDLVVTGTHGRNKMQHLFLGSIAEEIFRQAHCPVLTVGPQAPEKPGKDIEVHEILFATDFGPGAHRAAAYAFSVAQEHNATLTMLHVVENPADFTEARILHRREIEIARLKQLMPPGIEDWCKPELRVAFGIAEEEILQQAKERKADLIVMGAKPRNTLVGHTPATVAYHVVSKAACPVLTVRG